LSCALVGLFFRPLEPTLVETDDDEEEKRELNDNQIPLMTKNGSSKALEMTKSSSFASIPENGRFVGN
jgi:glutaredoxin 2